MKYTTFNIKSKFIFSILALALICFSCEEFEKYELPEAGSIIDETPPTAAFSFTQGEEEAYLTYSFSNLSSSATAYSWDFGDGTTSNEKEPTHTFPDTMDYTVTLVSSDALGASATQSESVSVRKPAAPEAKVPVIIEAGFEDNTLPDGTGDGRDSWRISGRTIFGITSGGSNFHTGNQGAKFEVAPENRLGYQEVEISANTNYKLIGYYKFKSSPAGGMVRFAMVAGSHPDADSAEAAIFASIEGGDLSTGDENNGYHKLELEFNSGANDVVGIWIDSNDMTEVRVDDMSIEVVE